MPSTEQSLKIRHVSVSKLTNDPKNARVHNERNILAIAESLKRFGQRKNIVVAKDGTVIAGNGTLEAARRLGWKTIAVSDAPPKKSDQRAFALADNRTAELASWDDDILRDEIEFLTQQESYGLPVLEDLGFSQTEVEGYIRGAGELDPQYTRKIVAPIYEPNGDKPKVSSLFNDEKTKELVEEIDGAKKLPADVAAFLRLAAQRHTSFDFRRIAEFYAHADAKTQRLFEKSALVIIDFDKAIENGFVRLTERLGSVADSEGWKE